MTRRAIWLAAALWTATPAALIDAQQAEPAGRSGAGHPGTADHAHHRFHGPVAGEAAFAERARTASERYRDRRNAISDGYRRLGPDFPAMGEHWVHPTRMVEGSLEIERPQALAYAIVAGEPVLTGVIYAKPLRQGEAPPEFPFPGLPWHDHVGAIDEESVLLHHAMSAEGNGFRLSMLHAWVWTSNPDGVFAADNWALPFFRLGLPVPERVPVPAARALSLAADGDVYYHLLFRALTEAGDAEQRAARAALREARARVEQWLGARPEPGAPLGGDELGRLAGWWVELWDEIGGTVDYEAAARLRAVVLAESTVEAT
jgi:hypothetical protein